MHTSLRTCLNSAFAFSLLLCSSIAHELPKVDLGYNIHQAASLNVTGQYYNFTNIRYASPPLGSKRFAAPEPPSTNRSVIQTGSEGASCPQAVPDYLGLVGQVLGQYLTTGSTNLSALNHSASAPETNDSAGPVSEDCLFLDVVVPTKVFGNAGRASKSGAPVLVWIYGGSYTFGSKTYWGNPAGLLAQAQSSTEKGIIFVAMNYRLGAFGWLAGPTLQMNGTANAGLYDQRMALQWIQRYIHLFGGDPDQVTVMGESAGGGSTLLQLTAFGGLAGSAPFQRAILQSPGIDPTVSYQQQEQMLQNFLATANVSTIEEARNLPSDVLIRANQLVVKPGAYGTMVWGPAVDGLFVPAMPGKLLSQGSFDKRVQILVGHNSNEGLAFASPFVRNDTGYIGWLTGLLPSATPSTINYIASSLYPPVLNGTSSYKDQFQRVALTIGDLAVTCNAHYMAAATANSSHSYQFSLFPGVHAQDIPYTFFNGPDPAVPFPGVAHALQEAIVRFTATGNPNSAGGLGAFPVYGDDSKLLNLNVTIGVATDPAANARCDWWQKQLYA